MAFILSDRVRETNPVSGTSPVQLGGVVPGYQSFASVMSNGSTTYYAIVDNGASVWEVGIGTFNAGQLTRTAVLSSSNAGQSVQFAGNPCDCFMDIPASALSILGANGHLVGNNNPPPTISSTTGDTLDTYASDAAGTVTGGTNSVGWTVTFGKPYTTTPHVVLSSPNGSSFTSYSVTAAGLTMTYNANTGAVFTYMVVG